MVLVLSSAYLLVGVLGLILIDTSVNILAINQADNVLHLAGALSASALWRHRHTGDPAGGSLIPCLARAGMGVRVGTQSPLDRPRN